MQRHICAPRSKSMYCLLMCIDMPLCTKKHGPSQARVYLVIFALVICVQDNSVFCYSMRSSLGFGVVRLSSSPSTSAPICLRTGAHCRAADVRAPSERPFALRSRPLVARLQVWGAYRPFVAYINTMQRFASSQSYTSFEDQRRPAITSDMSPFHHSPSPTSAPFASMLPPPPPTPDAVSALGTPGAPHPPIALSSHSSSSHLHHQAGFDTFDDIQWSWNSPSIDSARHQLSSSATQHDPLSSHAAGANVHYGYSFSSPASQSNSFGPGSPHSPHLYNPANSDATSGPGGANAGGFGPLSAPGSNVGSYSTSPPIISPLASMPPHNPDGEAVYQARSGSSGSSHATSLLSSSLTMNTIDYQPNPAQARPTLAAHFTFPSTAPSTTPSQAISHQLGRSTSSHTPNHARSSHQTHHHHSFSMPQSLTPAQLNTDWSTSPPLSGFMGHSPGTPSLHAVPDSPHSPSMISLSGTTMASPGTGTGNGARPIRRRPVRKSESDSSYSSPISAAARIQMARTLSGNGGSMNMSSAPASHEMTISTSGGPGSYAMYMPSPSSPLAASPPVIPGYLPATQYHHQHVQNSTHKHSRSRSSGGSSSPGTMGMLLSTSPTSPADITLAMAASRPGAGYLRGMSTNAGILGDESKPLVDEAMNMSDVEDDLSPIADGAGIDGDGADEGGMKKRRRRSLKEEKDSTSPKPKEEGMSHAFQVSFFVR
ncbi:hypothetical protein DL93DRAFT_443425 [Clavulina sp. PMI_390]|nr:hypothetical protein DL93DRAFT_443425 [Clavulina sp. PMI_390]